MADERVGGGGESRWRPGSPSSRDEKTNQERAGRLASYRHDLAQAWDRLRRTPRLRRDFAALRRSLPGRLRAARRRLGPDSTRILRLTTAAVIAYLVVEAVFPGLRDLTGPLTALLVVQASLVQTFSNGLGRIAAVLTGVLVATILASVTGLTWWSLGLAVGLALTLAHVMNLGDHVLETPISAMLILGVSSPETAAETRVAMTLIGAAVGVGLTLLLPPRVMTAGMPEAVRDVAERTTAAVRRTAAELPLGASPGRFDVWIRSMHRVLPFVASADAQITEAENRRRFNPRAIGRDEAIPVLRAGLSSLDRVILALRHTLMLLQARVPDETRATPDDPLLEVLAVVLSGIGDATESYGRGLAAEANGEREQAASEERACQGHVEETKAMLTELALATPDAASAWLVDPVVLSGLEGVLHELDVDRRQRRLDDWRARQAAAGVFSPPPVLDRAWPGRSRTKRALRERRTAEATGPGAPPAATPAKEMSPGPPTLAITYREGLAAPAPPLTPGPPTTRTSGRPSGEHDEDGGEQR